MFRPFAEIEKGLGRCASLQDFQETYNAGGSGFIGLNLAETLAEENDVVILDDLFISAEKNQNYLK